MNTVLYQITGVAVVSLLAGLMYGFCNDKKNRNTGFALFIATLLLIAIGISAKSEVRMWPEGTALFGASILGFIIGSLFYRKEKPKQAPEDQAKMSDLDYKNFLQ